MPTLRQPQQVGPNQDADRSRNPTEQWRHATAGHSGGSIWDDEDLAAAHQFVADIEDLRRHLTVGGDGWS